MDNILFMQEIMKNYHKKGGDLGVLLKVDVQKAYDYFKWSFLMEVLEAMGFPTVVQEWIYECISSVQYSVNMNEFLEGNFRGSRGL